MRKQNAAQREVQLLAEWLGTLPAHYRWRTHVPVQADMLVYRGEPLTPARRRAFGAWSKWADARVFTGSMVWLVEAKIVATGSAYGQLYDYLHEYRSSEDYREFAPADVVGVVLAAFAMTPTIQLFTRWGIRTDVFTPSWAGESLAMKVHHAGPTT